MQAIRDIFAIWPNREAMARDANCEPDTVYRWERRKRIPQECWSSLIEGARRLGRDLSADDLLAANAPMKPRGRPAHKVRRLKSRRSEARPN